MTDEPSPASGPGPIAPFCYAEMCGNCNHSIYWRSNPSPSPQASLHNELGDYGHGPMTLRRREVRPRSRLVAGIVGDQNCECGARFDNPDQLAQHRADVHGWVSP
jgi:hypothetical protein